MKRKIEKFEDIECWQIARKLVKNIYEMTNKHTKLSKDYSLKDQIQRAAVSIMNNIAEGFDRYSNKEFINFLNIAKGSAAEVKSLLYVLCDLNFISLKNFEEKLEKVNILSKQINALIGYTRKSAS